MNKNSFKIDINEFKKLNFKAIYAWPLIPKIMFLIVVMLLTVFVFYFTYISKQKEKLEKEIRNEVSLKEDFSKMKKETVNIPAYKNQLKDIETTFGTILKQLPNRLAMDDLIRDINQAGLSRNLEFILFEPEKQEIKTDFYAELPINIEVKGTFYDIGSFSADLAALSRIVVLSDIRINTLENTDMVLMKAKAKTYRYLDEEEIAEQARIAKEAAEKARKSGKGKGKGKENAQKAGSKSDTAVKNNDKAQRNSVKAKSKEEVKARKEQVQKSKK